MFMSFYRLTIVFSIFFCLISPAYAQEEWRSSYPPIQISVDRHIINAFAEKFEAVVKGEKVPFARRLIQLKEGKIDILAGLLKDETREEYAYFFSKPYKNKTNKVFIMRKSEGALLKSYEDLYKLKVSVQIGSKYFPRFDKDENIEKVATTKDANRLQMLLLRRFDALVHTEVYATDLVHRMGASEKVEFAPYKYTQYNPVYIAVSKKSPLYERRYELETVFNNMLESGEIDRIIQSYFSSRDLPVPDYK